VICKFQFMATAWGHESAFINMVVVPDSFLVAARGLRPRDELSYRAEDDSQYAVIPCGGPVRVLMRNGSPGFRSRGENSRTLDEEEGPIEAFLLFTSRVR
jgi:hypothetical protein